MSFCFTFEGGDPLGYYPGGWIGDRRYLYDFTLAGAKTDVCLSACYVCRGLHLYHACGADHTCDSSAQESRPSSKGESAVLETVLKIIGIAYIAEFGAQVTRDAGQGSIAAKIELAGKVLILIMAIPIINVIIETIVKFFPLKDEIHGSILSIPCDDPQFFSPSS